MTRGLGDFTLGGANQFSDSVKLWDLATQQEYFPPQGLGLVAISPDGKTWAWGHREETRVEISDAATGSKRITLPRQGYGRRALAFGPDGKTLVTELDSGALKLWDPATGKERATLQKPPQGAVIRGGLRGGPEMGISSIVFAPGGRFLIVRSPYGQVRLWDVVAARERSDVPVRLPLAFSPEGNRLALVKSEEGMGPGNTQMIVGKISGLNSVQGSPPLEKVERILTLWDLTTGKQSTSLKGHLGEVGALVFAPDGKTLAAGGAAIILWDIETGKQKVTLPTPGGCSALCLSPDGQTLAAGQANGTLTLWDVASGKERITLQKPSQGVIFATFSPDGRTLALGIGDATCKLWDVASREQRTTIAGPRYEDLPKGTVRGRIGGPWSWGFPPGPPEVAFSPDSRLLALGRQEGALQLWEVNHGKEVARLQESGLMALAYDPDGKLLLTGHADGAIRRWDTAMAKEVGSPLPHIGPVDSLTFSSDGRTLAAGGPIRVTLWDMATGKQGLTLFGNSPVAFTGDGKTVLTGISGGGVQAWNSATGQEKVRLQGLKFPVSSLVVAPDGKTVIARDFPDFQGNYKLWDIAIGNSPAPIEGVGPVTFSPAGKLLAGAGPGGTVKLWDLASGQVRNSIPGHKPGVGSIEFSPDGRTLVTAEIIGGPVKLWDVATGRERATLRGPVPTVFSPDSKLLATDGPGGTVKLWDAVTGTERAALKGHTAPVRFLAFVSGGTQLISRGRDDLIKLWDVATGKELFSFREGGLLTLVPRQTTLALGSGSGMVKVWDFAARKEPILLQRPSVGITALAFSPDGKVLATGNMNGSVGLWDVARSQQLGVLEGHKNQVLSLAFSSDSQSLATGSSDGWKHWDLTTRQVRHSYQAGDRPLIRWAFSDRRLAGIDIGGSAYISEGGSSRAISVGDSGDIKLMRIAPDVRSVAKGGFYANAVRLREIDSGKERHVSLRTIPGTPPPRLSWEFSADGQTIATGSSEGTIKLWDVTSAEERVAFKGPSKNAQGKAPRLTFSQDGSLLACIDGTGGVQLWQTALNRERAVLRGHLNAVHAVAFADKGRLLASGGFDRAVKLWDAATGKELDTLHGHAGIVLGLAVSPDGTLLASASADQTVRLWRLSDRKELHRLEGHTAPVWSAAFSPDARRLASAGSDGRIILWDVASGKAAATLSGSSAEIFALAYSPDGKTLAAAEGDLFHPRKAGAVKLWDLTAGKVRAVLQGHHGGVRSVAFSPDGATLAAGSWDATIKLWNPSTGQELATLAGHAQPVSSVVFSADGKTLASAGCNEADPQASGEVKLWDVASGQVVPLRMGHRCGATGVAFAPDGLTLASASFDETVKLWPVTRKGTTPAKSGP